MKPFKTEIFSETTINRGPLPARSQVALTQTLFGDPQVWLLMSEGLRQIYKDFTTFSLAFGTTGTLGLVSEVLYHIRQL